MSALRKLRALREKEASAKQVQQEFEEVAAKPVANPFDLLAEDEEVHGIDSESTTQADATLESKPRKKKAPKAKPKDKTLPQDDNLDALLQEFKVPVGDSKVEATSASSTNSLFRTEAKAFDMELEVKKRFGAIVMRENKKKRGHGNKFGHLRKPTLVRPSDEWPVFQERSHDMLSLGQNCFQMVPTDRAQFLDREYEQWAGTHDPQAIVSFSSGHPYHQQCLLTLSHLLESQGDFAAAHKFVQMCVYSLEQCFSTDFKIFEGTSRVSCELEAHQVLFAALYRHSQLLGKTGCPRTGLEVAKFLLSLSPDRDPQCVLFALDYLAIRSQEYAYLLSFVSLFDPGSFALHMPFPGPVHSSLHYPPACLLPNMIFSCALAKFCMEGKKGDVCKGLLSPGWFQHDLSRKSASELLQCAILLFPEAIPELLEKASDRELEKSVWKHMLVSLEGLHAAHPYVDKLVSIFAERSASLWSDDVVLQWVQDNTAEALSKWPMVKAVLREMRLWFYTPRRPVPNHVRMLAKNHYSDEVPSVPDELRVAAERAELKQDLPRQVAPEPARAQQALPLDANPLAVMLMSLLPWYGVQPGGGAPRRNEDDSDED